MYWLIKKWKFYIFKQIVILVIVHFLKFILQIAILYIWNNLPVRVVVYSCSAEEWIMTIQYSSSVWQTLHVVKLKFSSINFILSILSIVSYCLFLHIQNFCSLRRLELGRGFILVLRLWHLNRGRHLMEVHICHGTGVSVDPGNITHICSIKKEPDTFIWQILVLAKELVHYCDWKIPVNDTRNSIF